MIKAIETSYKGYRFRSRLEARWAVFFDALGVSWKYEDQGYAGSIDYPERAQYFPEHVENQRKFSELTNEAWKNHLQLDISDELMRCAHGECGHGSESARWLPDFVLHDGLRTWYVEVKGGDEALQKDMPRLVAVAEQNELDVIVLGEIPFHGGRHGLQMHPVIRTARPRSYRESDNYGGPSTHSGLGHFHPGFFSEHGFGRGIDWLLAENWDSDWHLKPKFRSDLFIETRRAYPDVRKAYEQARAARFEHGESGAARR